MYPPAKAGPINYLSVKVFLAGVETVAPDLVKGDGGADVPEAVVGDFAEALLDEELADVHASDALGFGGFDAEGFAVKIEVEAAGGAVAPAVVEGELVGKVAVGVELVTVAEPVFAGDGNVQQRGTHVDEGHIEGAAVERDSGFVVFGRSPKTGENLGLVLAGHEFYFFVARGFGFIREVKDLATGAVGVHHGDADDLRGEGPEAEELLNFTAASGALFGIGDAFSIAKQIFFLDIIEAVDRKGGSFDIKNEFGHGRGRSNQGGGPAAQARSSTLRLQVTSSYWSSFSFLQPP